MKILKILIAFLVSVVCFTPFSVYVGATDIVTGTGQEVCPDSMICTYTLDENLGVYMLSNVEDENSISTLEDSGSDTSISSMYVQLQNGSTLLKEFDYPNTREFAQSNVDRINVYWDSAVSKGEYVNINFSITLNHTSEAFYNISEIKLNGGSIGQYSISGNQLWFNHTTTVSSDYGAMNVLIKFNKSYSFNDSITLSASYKIDENGQMNSNLTAMKNFLDTILYEIQYAILPLVESIDSNVFSINNLLASSVVPKLEQIRSALVNDISIKLTNVNAHLSNINSSIKSLTTTIETKFNELATNLNTHFTNLSNWIQSQTNSINSKLDEVINVIKGESVTTDFIGSVMDSTTDSYNSLNTNKNEIEVGLLYDFMVNMESIELNNNLFKNNDFLITANFISTQMNNVVNSNDVYKTMVTYGLILGLACTLIGIAVKR